MNKIINNTDKDTDTGNNDGEIKIEYSIAGEGILREHLERECEDIGVDVMFLGELEKEKVKVRQGRGGGSSLRAIASVGDVDKASKGCYVRNLTSPLPPPVLPLRFGRAR